MGFPETQNHPGDVVSSKDLFERLAEELRALQWLVTELQETAGQVAEQSQLNAKNIRDLQKIDMLTQVLDDLGRLTTWISNNSETSNYSIDGIRSQIRLVDLSERLSRGEVILRGSDGSPGDVSMF
ncbi:MAG: hypothetical protein AAF871_15680 [Pseudomonadota bacterium]